jgi:signal transduction histidine kinase
MGKHLVARTFDPPVVRQPTDLDDLLRSAAGEMAPFVQQRHQTLAVDAAADLGTMNLEPDKLRDSVEHLLLNAIKFTPDGGTIRLSGRRLPDGGAEIRVTDTGMGIEPASLQRLFQPFFTAFDVSRHRSGVFEYDRRGLGLGLSLVKTFIERLGGQISAESEVGRGATFIITLPQA